ncbi:hypothetical protein LO82_22285 [Vibrio vulnificus]|uniref:metallophosphoesterase family protein n=1 Tax=Vibrio vulnificus TaxID=672 RepID=UPI0006C44B7A|nr:metallophosphoesterase [Vibrio vulnificus]KOR93724.1 hypothetical protein LO82_22285 [Vibrio vulnificus]HDY8067577.1 metallophosphoesterase [Vibrio vulnificus]
MNTPSMNILHISDVHFKENEATATQSQITKALVSAIENYGKPIHYCVFTGDLANHALTNEYKLAEEWLESVFSAMGNSNAKMIICPGNHDIDRSSADVLTARGAATSKKLLDTYLGNVEKSFKSLSKFLDWHEEFRSKNSWVISSWDKHVNLSTEVHNDLNINFVMANSALLSCDNDDLGNLCVDLNQLNACLEQSRDNKGLNICMMHHPLDGGWLSEWNLERVDTLLKQKASCHILMSGHVHDAEGASSSNSYGQALASFKCGSAYTGGDWKKEFSILEVDIEGSKVIPNNFVYSERSGQWYLNNEQSQPILVDFSSVKQSESGKKKY